MTDLGNKNSNPCWLPYNWNVLSESRTIPSTATISSAGVSGSSRPSSFPLIKLREVSTPFVQEYVESVCPVPKRIDQGRRNRFPFEDKAGDITAAPFGVGGDACGQLIKVVVAEEFELRKTAARLCGRSGSMTVIEPL